MRVPNSEHTSRPWRVGAVTRGFRLEDVWRLPATGGPGDFTRLVELFASLDPARTPSVAVRALLGVRTKLGRLFGWDDSGAGTGARVPTLRDRLPADLQEGPSGPTFVLPFTPLYLLDDEFAAETANRTMHGVLHLGWVPEEDGGWRGFMAVYVKPNGLFGRAYMAAIKPFRYLIVYPRLMKAVEQAWLVLGGGSSPPGDDPPPRTGRVGEGARR